MDYVHLSLYRDVEHRFWFQDWVYRNLTLHHLSIGLCRTSQNRSPNVRKFSTIAAVSRSCSDDNATFLYIFGFVDVFK